MLPIYLIVQGMIVNYYSFIQKFGHMALLIIFFLLLGVVGLSIQIINQIAGSLLKDDKIIWKFVKDLCIIIMFIFMFCWFITGNT